MTTNARILIGILTLLTGMGLAANAADQSTQPRWLPLTAATPEQSVQVSLESATAAGLVISLDTPGVLATPVRGADGNQYTQLSIPGCGATAERIGLPELPFKGFFLEIPYGVDVSVEMLDMTAASLGRGFAVYPLQPPQPDSGDVQYSFQIDEAAYAQDSFLPTAPVVLGEPGFIRGRRVVFVQVFPLRHNPASTELRAFTSLRFSVCFDGLADPGGEFRKARLASCESEKRAQQYILNYEAVEPLSRTGGLIDFNGADYLIIVADKFHNETELLATWKHRKGFVTRMVNVSTIGNNSTAIKNYIKTAYDTWTPAPSFVLLVGDSGDVAPGQNSIGLSCTSDLVYACVDGGDIFPDLTIARVPVATDTQCANVVDKILKYECDPDLGGWYDDFLAAAEFEESGTSGVSGRWFMETAMTVYDFLVNENNWDGHTALCPNRWPMIHQYYHFRSSSFPHRPELNQVRWGVSPYPDPIPTWITDKWTEKYQAAKDVSTAINAGVSIVQHRDHGSTTSWGHPPYNVSNIYALTNGVKTPVVFSFNCSSGSFQVSECFCEAFMRKYPGGAVGAVGATTTSYSGYNDLTVHGLYTGFWPAYDTTHTGNKYPNTTRPAEALDHGKYYMYMYEGPTSTAKGTFFMFHYFGDPEMPLRTATPAALLVSHPTTVALGQPVDVTVTVQMGGSPLADALVCISHPTAEDHWRDWTGNNGVVTFSGITFSQSGDYDLVVTAQNAIPYEGTVTAGVTKPGDLNCDGVVNLDDIDPFVLALSGQAAYYAVWPSCNWFNGDIDGNGTVDFDDIDPFVKLLTP